jgi:hypothetical protein
MLEERQKIASLHNSIEELDTSVIILTETSGVSSLPPLSNTRSLVASKSAQELHYLKMANNGSSSEEEETILTQSNPVILKKVRINRKLSRKSLHPLRKSHSHEFNKQRSREYIL